MNEVAPYAYQPSLDLTFYSNQKSGNQYAPFTSSRKNTDAAFFGNFSGAVASDNDCKVEHVHSTSRDANGESLQECHCILNLTINKPAMTASDPSKRYTALIPYVRTINNADYITTVHDIHFIGGEISSGDTDCMPASYSSGAYNVCTATVIGYSNYADMYNVHSSATVKAGTGKQYSVRMGGLMASGYFHRITDCTNSGDIIGGYVEMPAENIQSENYQIGGLLGGAGANSNTLDDRYIGRIIHCANHGNIYSFEVVTDEDNEWKLTGGACYAAGITTGYLATPNTGSTKNNPTGVASYYFDDSKRGGRNANFGMIFDGPIMLDENGDPVFDTDDKPVPLPLSEGKKSVANESPAYQKYIYGIGDNVICNAYNGANLYSVMNEKTHISGIGNCSTAYSSSLGQYYNFLNYNTGNIYMYVGGCEAYGIADKYAYQCYNVGDIFAEGKITTASTYDTSSDSAGCFAGISGYNSRGCYNKGDIYIAPTERALYNGVTTSNNLCIAACGVSIRYADGMEKTVDDEKILYKTINNGTVTIDLEKNNFDPVKNTTDTTNNAYYPRFAMIGTGLGSYNENYGTFDLQLNPNDTTPMIFLRIASCGGVFGNNNHNATTLSHCVNYSDIYVDTTNTENSLYYLFIQGLGYCYGSSAGGINHSINLGDITFKGRIGGDISIRSLSTCSLAKECVNLGDITIDESSVIGGTCEIHDLYCTTSSTTENVMLGWYSGCEMPGNTIETEFEEFFDKLDPNKRYGVKNVSGTFKSYMKVISILGSPTAKSIYNNGATNIENVNAAVNSYQMYIYNLSYSIYCSYCVNNAPITMNNVLMKNNCYVAACSPGNHNLNNADINISHTISQTTQDTRVSAFVSYTNNNNSVTAITSTPSHCENRGNITIKEGMTATVQGTDYDVTSATTTARWRVSGIAQKCSDSINFGKITVSNVHRLSVGGVGAILVGAVSNCLNYGEISCDNCGGWVRVGGITDYTNAYAVDQSYNFAKIIVMNPTSYKATDEPYVYIGGIVAYSLNKTVTSCANYGEIVYNNTKGKNTSSTDYTNTRTTSDLLLCVGGIVGYEQNSAIKSCLNYADVKVDREDNMHIFTGGIVGQSYLTTTTVNENLINYGNVTVPASDSTKKQYVMAGGIIGAPALKRADGNNNSSSNIKRIKYAVNYGTVSASSADDNTYVGSICGMGAFKFINNTTNTFNTDSRYYNIDLCLDLSNLPEDSTFYPLIGGKNNHTNKGTEGNFTKNADSVDDTATAVGTKFGEVKLVTLNKNQDTGVFSAAFPYRSKLSTEVADSTIDLDTNTENVGLNRNLDNLLVYQDYNLLSHYLQEYLVSHFGEEII
ncbi:MAG: hypothetical protein IJ192_02625, partial [Clostridia bacterium]|nr:hypothetical protein [Clostridia bacterium]